MIGMMVYSLHGWLPWRARATARRRLIAGWDLTADSQSSGDACSMQRQQQVQPHTTDSLPGHPGRETCVWMPGFRAKLSPGLDLIRAAPSENGWCLKRKEGDHAGKRRRCRVSRGQNTPILHTAKLTRAASGRKTAGKRRRHV